MKAFHSLRLIWTVLGAAALAAPGFSQIVALETELGSPDLAYDADLLVNDGNAVTVGRLHRAPGRERLELEIEGDTVVAILRADSDEVWLLVPKRRIYAVTDRDDPLVGGLLPLPAGDRRQRIRFDGEDSISGVATRRYRVYGVATSGELYEGMAWVSGRGIVLRAGVVDRGRSLSSRLELSNVRIRPQTSSLFIVPEGFSRATITSESLGSASSTTASRSASSTRVSGGRDVIRVEDESGVVEVDREVIEEGVSLLGKLAGRAWKAIEGDRAHISCKPGRPCQVGSNAFARLTCDGGGCEMLCGSSSNCIFECPGGECAITCGSTSRCEIDCEDGCDVTCGSLARCSGDR